MEGLFIISDTKLWGLANILDTKIIIQKDFDTFEQWDQSKGMKYTVIRKISSVEKYVYMQDWDYLVEWPFTWRGFKDSSEWPVEHLPEVWIKACRS